MSRSPTTWRSLLARLAALICSTSGVVATSASKAMAIRGNHGTSSGSRPSTHPVSAVPASSGWVEKPTPASSRSRVFTARYGDARE